jgi:hypothetical protein
MTDTEEIIEPTELPKRKRKTKPKAKKEPKEIIEPPHGTRARYGWKLGKCRCRACRAANTKWQQEYRDSKRVGAKRYRPKAIHGTRAKYVAGCRCPECTKANRDYQRDMARIYRKGLKASDMLPEDLSKLD